LTALLPQRTGVDVSLIELVCHLGRIDRDNEYHVFVNAEDASALRGVLPAQVRHHVFCRRPRTVRLLFQQAILPVLATRLRLDVVHSPSFIMPMWRGRARHLLTIHDLSSFSLPALDVPLRRSRTYRRAVLTSIRRADMISVPSDFVHSQLREWVPDLPPERIRVIRWGISENFKPQDSAQVSRVARKLGLRAPYILFVGTIQPRKNLGVVVEAFRRLLAAGHHRVQLVLAGRLGWGYEPLLTLCQQADLRDHVRCVQYVEQSDLPPLYAGASLFVCPSLEEGFGFPPLEAMATGIPTIVSSASALVENVNGAAEVVSPDDVAGWAAAMRQLLDDEDLRARRRDDGLVRAAQFRWETAAQQTLAIYRALAM